VSKKLDMKMSEIFVVRF